MGVANTLAYYATPTSKNVKSFIVAPGVITKNIFKIISYLNKIEGYSLSVPACLV
jgi:hypothetical protein